MNFLVCYDIAKPSRLQRIAKILEQYGIRLQKSFFHCDLPHSRMNELWSLLEHTINPKEDALFLYPICTTCLKGRMSLGTGPEPLLEPYAIL
jgi:CRISPR-associated protein Cas2